MLDVRSVCCSFFCSFVSRFSSVCSNLVFLVDCSFLFTFADICACSYRAKLVLFPKAASKQKKIGKARKPEQVASVDERKAAVQHRGKGSSTNLCVSSRVFLRHQECCFLCRSSSLLSSSRASFVLKSFWPRTLSICVLAELALMPDS